MGSPPPPPPRRWLGARWCGPTCRVTCVRVTRGGHEREQPSRRRAGGQPHVGEGATHGRIAFAWCTAAADPTNDAVTPQAAAHDDARRRSGCAVPAAWWDPLAACLPPLPPAWLALPLLRMAALVALESVLARLVRINRAGGAGGRRKRGGNSPRTTKGHGRRMTARPATCTGGGGTGPARAAAGHKSWPP